jgi:hypothetical protein
MPYLTKLENLNTLKWNLYSKISYVSAKEGLVNTPYRKTLYLNEECVICKIYCTFDKQNLQALIDT